MRELLCAVCVQGVAVGGAAIEAHLVAQRRVDAPPQHLAQRLIARLAWVEQKLHRLVAPILGNNVYPASASLGQLQPA